MSHEGNPDYVQLTPPAGSEEVRADHGLAYQRASQLSINTTAPKSLINLGRAYVALWRQQIKSHDLEAVSRLAFPEAWAKVDANITDDDWMGGTALNLRDTLLKETRAVLDASRLAKLEQERGRGEGR